MPETVRLTLPELRKSMDGKRRVDGTFALILREQRIATVVHLGRIFGQEACHERIAFSSQELEDFSI